MPLSADGDEFGWKSWVIKVLSQARFMMGTEQGRAALHWALEGTRYHSDSAWLAELVRVMQVMYECNSSQSETLAEAVPEAMKNVLLVMATRGVLSPAWTVSGRDSIMLHALEYGQHEPWFHAERPVVMTFMCSIAHASGKPEPLMLMPVCKGHGACSKSHSLHKCSS